MVACRGENPPKSPFKKGGEKATPLILLSYQERRQGGEFNNIRSQLLFNYFYIQKKRPQRDLNSCRRRERAVS